MILSPLTTITVSGGTGTGTIRFSGSLEWVAIQPPSGAAQYRIDLLDQDGFGVDGRPDSGLLIGNTTFNVMKKFAGLMSIIIASASIDGSYQVKTVFEVR